MAHEVKAWMPFYPGDYLRDTAHLSTEAHGAYLLLIFHYWVHAKPIPDDDEQLSCITRLGIERWQKHAAIIRAFFVADNGVLRHKRIDLELAKALEISEARREAGRRGGLASQASARAAGLLNANQKVEQLVKQLPEQLGKQTGKQTAKQKSTPSQSPSHTPVGAGAPPHDEGSLDAVFYRRGKGILGQSSGGQLTKLKNRVGLGRGLEILDMARSKENPAEYVAGVLKSEPARGSAYRAAAI